VTSMIALVNGTTRSLGPLVSSRHSEVVKGDTQNTQSRWSRKPIFSLLSVFWKNAGPNDSVSEVIILAVTLISDGGLGIFFFTICIPIYGSTALVDLSRFLSFLIYIQSVGLLGRGISPSQGLYLHTEQQKHRINAHRHPCLEWDSNPRPQRPL
jgi:hypothetical protein